jgi:large subunit ribosomal protein L41
MFTMIQLTPFVTKKMKPTRGRFDGDAKGALSANRYLNRWKMENGDD